ncbi:unnamed protein product, partial [Mesorhabditis belari]|uniref:SET domain-containing protein n=1 Tax=Mesorhabditis belari TaxID=2138241 RepID=A0AAF3EPR2_9BILA
MDDNPCGVDKVYAELTRLTPTMNKVKEENADLEAIREKDYQFYCPQQHFMENDTCQALYNDAEDVDGCFSHLENIKKESSEFIDVDGFSEENIKDGFDLFANVKQEVHPSDEHDEMKPRIIARNQLKHFLEEEFGQKEGGKWRSLFPEFPTFEEWFELGDFTNRHKTRDHDYCLAIDDTIKSVVMVQMKDLSRQYLYISDVPTRLRNSFMSVNSVKEEDDNTYCCCCHMYYRPFCLLHPMFLMSTPTIRGSDAKATCPPYLKIKKSKIPGAGQGVFAKEHLAKNLVFGPYEGEIHFNRRRSDRSSYSWEVRIGEQHFFVDALDPMKSNWIRFINSYSEGFKQNMVAFQFRWRIYYQVIAPIKPGEELLVFYGENFKLNRKRNAL